jgi:hypothetical protein
MRRLTWLLLAVTVAAAGHSSRLHATPQSNFSNLRLLKATFDELDLRAGTHPTFWSSRLKTMGVSDLYVVDNLWSAGGTTGWHTHPGFSLIIVTGGALTVYESDDPTCTPHVYTTGQGFIDRGGEGHAHVIRNEAVDDATTTAVQLLPAMATRRIDAPHPQSCPADVN